MTTRGIVGILSILGYTFASGSPGDSTQIRTVRSLLSAASPQYAVTTHNVGNLNFPVSNNGLFGNTLVGSGHDFFTGNDLKPVQFPKGSDVNYVWAGFLWIGGVVLGDTLVSAAFEGWTGGYEFSPDPPPNGTIYYRSSISSESSLRSGSISHQDFRMTYYDTCTSCTGRFLDATDKRYHKPIGLRVDQTSYGWDYPHAENAVIITYTIRNISPNVLHDAYVGVCVDGDVSPSNVFGSWDDLVGYFDSTKLSYDCESSSLLPIAWTCDNEGDCTSGQILTPNVNGTVLLSLPSTDQHLSFNWWSPDFNYGSNDFGPMRKSVARNFGTGGTGIPYGDKNKYYLLSNGDVDYNQPFTGKVIPTDSIWVFPGSNGARYAQGAEIRYLLSVGPWDLAPGEYADFAIAYVGGYNLHTTWGNEANLPSHPDVYMNWLNFSDLEKNALNAKWIYDNPGVDSDSDGYAGKFTMCERDTVWYEGDGVPDLKADWPPPAPAVTVTPIGHGAIVRWNGQATERRINWFSKRYDFEGYQVLLRPANSPEWDTVDAYDIEDYLRVHWDTTMSRWECHEYPYPIDSLRARYASDGITDTTWKPLRYSPLSPFSPADFPDSLFYFAPVGCNASTFEHDTHIRKAYAEASRPPYRTVTDVPSDSVVSYLTAEGHFKYFEYELRIDDLVPADSYIVSVVSLSTGRASLAGFNPLASDVTAATFGFTPLSDSNCCIGQLGNVECSPDDVVDIADLTALIDNLFISFTPLCCVGEANIDGDPNGIIDISDITRLLDHLFINFPTLATCP